MYIYIYCINCIKHYEIYYIYYKYTVSYNFVYWTSGKWISFHSFAKKHAKCQGTIRSIHCVEGTLHPGPVVLFLPRVQWSFSDFFNVGLKRFWINIFCSSTTFLLRQIGKNVWNRMKPWDLKVWYEQSLFESEFHCAICTWAPCQSVECRRQCAATRCTRPANNLWPEKTKQLNWCWSQQTLKECPKVAALGEVVVRFRYVPPKNNSMLLIRVWSIFHDSYLELPFPSWSAFPSYVVAQTQRKHVLSECCVAEPSMGPNTKRKHWQNQQI